MGLSLPVGSGGDAPEASRGQKQIVAAHRVAHRAGGHACGEQGASNHAIIDAVGEVAAAHGVSRATIALAWLHRQPVVTAPLVGAGSAQQIDEAIASLDVELSDEDVRKLTDPYTPRYDFQGISDEAELEAIRARVPGMTPS